MEDVYMKRAIELARKGMGFTSPNPSVGAVVVKGGQIVAEGYHRKAGEDHAEVVVIKEVMAKSGIVSRDLEPALFHNATLYVTLEPCNHEGKTPACTELLKKASFGKVCVGMKDPFEKVNGKGIRKLKKDGFNVKVLRKNSTLTEEVRALNQPFIKWSKHGLPYVIMKAGMSLDGKLATSKGESKWITSSKAREDARLERSMCDAVVVGRGTVEADNPQLAPSGRYREKSLLRVIIDPKLSLNTELKVFRDENVLVACCSSVSQAAKKRFEKAGIRFKSFGKERVSVKSLLKYLAKRNVQSVFVEGGSGVNASFFEAAQADKKMIDEVLIYMAPKLIGGQEALSLVGGSGVADLKKAMKFKDFQVEKLGEDLKIEAKVNLY